MSETHKIVLTQNFEPKNDTRSFEGNTRIRYYGVSIFDTLLFSKDDSIDIQKFSFDEGKSISKCGIAEMREGFLGVFSCTFQQYKEGDIALEVTFLGTWDQLKIVGPFGIAFPSQAFITNIEGKIVGNYGVNSHLSRTDQIHLPEGKTVGEASLIELQSLNPLLGELLSRTIQQPWYIFEAQAPTDSGLSANHKITVQQIEDSLSKTTGKEFLQKLCDYLAKGLGMDTVMIGKTRHNGNIKGVIKNEGSPDEILGVFPSENTLMGELLASRKALVKQKDVFENYKSDSFLALTKAKACIGIPLFDDDDKAFGILMATSSEPIPAFTDELGNIMKLASTRVSAELGRLIYHQELLESEQRFRSLFNSSMEGFAYLSIEGGIRLVNERFCRIIGYSRKELEKLKTSDITPEKWLEPEYKYIQSIIGNPNPPTFEKEYIAKSGKIIPVEINAQMVYDENGAPIGAWGGVRDITERKEAEKKIQASEEKYRGIVEDLNEYIVRWTPDFKIKYMNPAFRKQFDVTTTEALPSMFEVFSPQAETQVEEKKAALQNATELNSSLEQLTFVNGVKRWVIWTDRGFYDEQGHLVEIQSVGVDITELQEIRNKLKVKEAEHRHILESLPLFVIKVDRDHNIQYINQVTDNYELEKVIGAPLSAFVPPEKLEEITTKVELVFEEQSTQSYETPVYHQDNTVGYYSSTIAPLMQNDKVISAILITKDVTEAVLQQRELERRNKELTKINEELDNFVYRVSHDLRAPLSSSLGLLGLCEREDDIVQLREYISLQKSSLQKLDAFIKDILDYSRNARTAVQHELVDWGAIIDQITLHHQVKIDSGEVVFDCHIPTNTPPFHSDKHRLDMILNNLINNAFKYRHPVRDVHQVKVSLSSDEQNIYIKIVDNGEGIMEEHIHSIFDMFVRATHNQPGSGLGLYIVGEATSKLGGTISVTSTYGEGSEFTLSLPLS